MDKLQKQAAKNTAKYFLWLAGLIATVLVFVWIMTHLPILGLVLIASGIVYLVYRLELMTLRVTEESDENRYIGS